jgi:site-specific recombinase XerD
MSPRAFNYLFDKYVLKAGLPKIITPHSARATFITQALENNCDIKDVQNTVKHANIATTQMYDKRAQHHKDSASLIVKF